MKKIIHYMQNQAVQYSEDKYNSASYLAPRGTKEPQQRRSHPRKAAYKSQHVEHSQSRASNPSAHAHSQPYHASGANGPFPIPSQMKKIHYGSDNILQSYEVYIPEDHDHELSHELEHSLTLVEGQTGPDHTGHHDNTASAASNGSQTPTPHDKKLWILYLHGGYFRDPTVTSSSFHPTLTHLINPHPSSHLSSIITSSIQHHIAGYASINYRLAPHDKYPQPPDTEDFEKRDAKWPDFMHDVLSAVHHLQEKYRFGEDYILVGHSVGATLAFLSVLDTEADWGPKIERPIAVVGVCGIYDFLSLHEKHAGYDSLTKNAVPDEKVWGEISPARYGEGVYLKDWAKERKNYVVIAQSEGDGLVDLGQGKEMLGIFEKGGDGHDGEGKKGQIVVESMEIEGKHNEVWEKGDELARVIARAVDVVVEG